MQYTKQYPKISSFTDLHAWQEGHKLVLLTYKNTRALPSSEKYNLIDQLQRASVSITSNIAEGFSRNSKKEKVQFLYIAIGSTKEAQNQLIICKDLGYISDDQFAQLERQCSIVSKLIYGLIKAFQKP